MQTRKAKQLNEEVLYALAGVAVTFAGFSGVVVVLPLRDGSTWSPTERRMLQLLIADSLIVLFLALLPIVFSLYGWSPNAIWGVSSALLGSWFLVGDYIAVRGELHDRTGEQSTQNPISRPVRVLIYLAALVMGTLLWLSVLNLLIPSSQALYVLGLMTLLAIAAVEFLFFINLLLLQGEGD